MMSESTSKSDKEGHFSLANKIHLDDVKDSKKNLSSDDSSNNTDNDYHLNEEFGDDQIEGKSSETLTELSQNQMEEINSNKISKENESNSSDISSVKSKSDKNESSNSSLNSLEQRIKMKYTDMSLGSGSPNDPFEESQSSHKSQSQLSVDQEDESANSYEKEIAKIEETNVDTQSEISDFIEVYKYKQLENKSEEKSTVSQIPESLEISKLNINEFIDIIPELLQEKINTFVEDKISNMEEKDLNKIKDFCSKFIYEKIKNFFSKSRNKLNMLSTIMIQKTAPYPLKTDVDFTFQDFTDAFNEDLLTSELIKELVKIGLPYKMNIADEVVSSLSKQFEEVLKKPIDNEDSEMSVVHDFLQKINNDLNDKLNQSVYINVFTNLILKTTREVFEDYEKYFVNSEQNLKYNLLKDKTIDTQKLMKFLSYRRDYYVSQYQESVMLPVFTVQQFRLLL
jgi:hypothetical protein